MLTVKRCWRKLNDATGPSQTDIMDNWNHNLALRDHNKEKYPIDAGMKAEHFETILEGSADDRSVKTDSEKKRPVKENRERPRSAV